MKNPKVTVLMPAYNTEKYIGEAIESVLHQTFQNFELLIIHDGSTDKTRSIIESYKDSRIRVIHHNKNKGIVSCLNEGLTQIQSTYIARMDADDISLSSRLEKQVAYMDAHPEISVCGTWLKVFNDKISTIWRAPTAHNEIQALMLFHDAMFHPTVIIRMDSIKSYNFRYSELYLHAEDYELWTRIMEHSLLANLPEVFLHHRIHQHKYADEYLRIQEKSANKIRFSQIRHLGIRPSKFEFNIHIAISMGIYKKEKSFVAAAERWMIKLLMANFKTNRYRHISFVKMIARLWLLVRWGGTSHEQ